MRLAGRPAGEVRQALLSAAQDLATPERGPTLSELATRAQVGLPAARRTVDNLTRAGQLMVARTRTVDYRNKPVAEYQPAPPPTQSVADDLNRAMALWVQR